MRLRTFAPATLSLLLALAACGGSAAPASSPAASSAAPKPAASAAASKPAASASAKPAASASAKPAASGAAKPAASGAAVSVPPIPAPVAVTLDPASTAFLVLDIATSNCVATRPACVASVPAINTLLKKARDAKVPVIYTYTSGNVLPDVAPQQGEPALLTNGPDKFNTPAFADALKQKNYTNLVMVGSSANGAILYTAFPANLRGYTVVVAEDGISSASQFDTDMSRWQLLNQPGLSNTENQPLASKMVTLSRSDMITFGTPSGGSASAKPATSGASAKPAASGASAKPAASGSAGAETVPAVPAEAAVTVDPKTTALMVLDINSAVCQTTPDCVSSVPAIAALIKKARDAKASVIYSSTPNATILSDVAPQGDEPTVISSANKFFNTNLADILKQKGITTAVVVGTAANGAVLYTGYESTAMGITVVVADDGISSRAPFATAMTKYQMLRFPANTDNKPLADKAVTLSRSDMITFGTPPAGASTAAKPAASAAAKPAGSAGASAKPAASTADAKPAASGGAGGAY